MGFFGGGLDREGLVSLSCRPVYKKKSAPPLELFHGLYNSDEYEPTLQFAQVDSKMHF